MLLPALVLMARQALFAGCSCLYGVAATMLVPQF